MNVPVPTVDVEDVSSAANHDSREDLGALVRKGLDVEPTQPRNTPGLAVEHQSTMHPAGWVTVSYTDANLAPTQDLECRYWPRRGQFENHWLQLTANLLLNTLKYRNIREADQADGRHTSEDGDDAPGLRPYAGSDTDAHPSARPSQPPRYPVPPQVADLRSCARFNFSQGGKNAD